MEITQDPREAIDLAAPLEPFENDVDKEVEDLQSAWPKAGPPVEGSVEARLLATRKAFAQDLIGKPVQIDSDDATELQQHLEWNN